MYRHSIGCCALRDGSWLRTASSPLLSRFDATRHASLRRGESPSEPAFCEPLERRCLLSGDHPSLSDYPDSSVVPLNMMGSDFRSSYPITGEIAFAGDDDLFSFEVPIGFTRGSVSVVQHIVGGLAPSLRIFNRDGTPFSPELDGRNGVASTPPETNFAAGQTYYVNVRAGAPSDPNEQSSIGTYSIFILMAETGAAVVQPPPSSPSAIPIQIDRQTGTGTATGSLSTTNPDQAYFFDVNWSGPVRVDVRSLHPGGITPLEPMITLFAVDGTMLVSDIGVSGIASLTVEAVTPRQRFILLVEPSPSAEPEGRVGSFLVSIESVVSPAEPPPPPPPVGAPPLVPPVLSDFLTAPSIELAGSGGSGARSGEITQPGEARMFRIASASARRLNISLEREYGSDFTGIIRVYNAAREQIAVDGTRSPGRLASIVLPSDADTEYFIRVEQFGGPAEVGAFVARVFVEPDEFVLYYPEGYSSAAIDEYVPLVNPNNFAISYTIIAHYEVGERDQVLAVGTLAPVTRGGITINSRRSPGQSLVRQDTPYALEIRASGPIGATFSHYDFGTTTGENFTSTLSTTWSFGQVQKDTTQYRDFLVYYNPNPLPTTVRIIFTNDAGEQTQLLRVVGGQRRAGINIDADLEVPSNGPFSVQIIADQPIVAALSSYGIVGNGGYGLLGQTQGALQGVIPTLRSDNAQTDALTLFNPGSQPASIVLVFTSVGSAAETVRQVTVPARSRLVRSLDSFSLGGTDSLSVRFVSDQPISLASSQRRDGDADSSGSVSLAATLSVIADAFINPAAAGTLYQESLTLYNPSVNTAAVTVTFMLPGGILGSTQVSVGARSYTTIDVDQLQLIQLLQQPSAIAIRINASTPIIASFSHYDLFLQGGWTAVASPLGLPTGLGGF